MEKSSEGLRQGKNSLIKKSLQPQELHSGKDYEEYRLSPSEGLIYGAEAAGVGALFAYVFYRSAIAFLFMVPVIVLFMKKKRRELKEKRKNAMIIQFRELMNSLISGLYAGYSVENAFTEAYKDMVMLFGKKAVITLELGSMIRKMRNNVNIEELLEDFGKRSHIQDIEDFAEVFRIAKRSGGDMAGMIKQTADIIAEKLESKRKIVTIISSKKLEQTIMNMVPFGIILYIDASSPGFFDSLYHNVKGVLIMTAMALVYIFAYCMAEKITDIKV